MIYLAKIGAKEYIHALGSNLITEYVKNELLKDKSKHLDAQIIDDNLKNKHLKEYSEKIALKPHKKLGVGELSTIEASIITNTIPVIDDKQAIKIAISRGLKTKTAEFILIELLKTETIGFDQFMEFFMQLAKIKSLKPDVIDFFTKMATALTNRKEASSL